MAASRPETGAGSACRIRDGLPTFCARSMTRPEAMNLTSDDWHADPDYALQEASDDHAANHGSNDTCLLEIEGSDQHHVQPLEDHIPCSGFRTGLGIERRQSRLNGFASHNHWIDWPFVASFEISRNRLDVYGSALHSSLQAAAHSRCEVRNCLARRVRLMPNCFRLIYFRYQR